MSDLIKTIKDSLENLVTLEIVTAVGRPAVDDDGKPQVDYAKDLVMFSRINLIDGDITNILDSSFVNGEHQDLRTFHEDQVNEGQQIIRDNLAALKELYELAKQLDSEEKPQS